MLNNQINYVWYIERLSKLNDSNLTEENDSNKFKIDKAVK